jgi:hypothetical protein
VLIAGAVALMFFPRLALGQEAGTEPSEIVAPTGIASVFVSPLGAAMYVGGPSQVLDETVAGVPFDPGLGSFQLDIAFDPSTVSLGIAEGPFLASTGRTTSCALTFVTERSVLFGCASSGSQRGPYGSGVLARLTVAPMPGLDLVPTLGNGRLAFIDNRRTATELHDTEGGLVSIKQLLDAVVLVAALPGDVNQDCVVNILDEELESIHYNSFFGMLLFQAFLDLEPANGDFDIDIKDLQFVFGRDGDNCETPQPTPITTGTPIIPTVPAVTRTPTPTNTPTATPDPTITRTPTVTSTRTAVGSESSTPSTSRTPARTRTPGAGTPRPGSTPVNTVSPGQTVRAGSPTAVRTVLGTTNNPGSLPPTGRGGVLGESRWTWLLTLGSIALGVLLVVGLRQVLFRRDDEHLS